MSLIGLANMNAGTPSQQYQRMSLALDRLVTHTRSLLSLVSDELVHGLSDQCAVQ